MEATDLHLEAISKVVERAAESDRKRGGPGGQLAGDAEGSVEDEAYQLAVQWYYEFLRGRQHELASKQLYRLLVAQFR
jgi:hypothetical protein